LDWEHLPKHAIYLASHLWHAPGKKKKKKFSSTLKIQKFQCQSSFSSRCLFDFIMDTTEDCNSNSPFLLLRHYWVELLLMLTASNNKKMLKS